MAISRPSNWDNQFSNSIINSSDLIISLSSDTTKKITKNNIKSFKHTLKNSLFYNGVPYDKATLVIKGWNELSSTLKEKFAVKGTFFQFKYGINNLESSPFSMVVYDFELDLKNDSAKVVFSGGLEDTTNLGTYTIANYQSDTRLMFDTLNTLAFLKALNYDSSSCSTSYSSNIYNPVDAQNMTALEMLQNIAIATGEAIVSEFVLKAQNYLSEGTTMYYVNVVEMDYVEEPTTTIVQGMELANSEVVGLGNTSGSSGTLSDPFFIPSQYENYKITGWNTTGSPNINKTEQRIDINLASTIRLTSAPNNWTATAKGKKFIKEQITNQKNRIVFSPFIDSNNKTDVQTRADNYFRNSRVYTYKCRINPVVRPLDYISVSFIGNHYVESVEYEFNGAYFGTIVGRLYQPSFQYAPKINFDYDDANTYTLKIENRNKFDCKVYIEEQNDDIFYTYTIGAGQTLVLTQDDIPDVSYVLAKWLVNELDDDLYCRFSVYNHTTSSTYTTILEANEGLQAPEIEDSGVNAQDDWYFEIYNPNPSPCELKVYYSGGSYTTFNIDGFGYFTINQNNATSVSDSVREYLNETLIDPVYCNLDNGTWSSNNTILLEENN